MTRSISAPAATTEAPERAARFRAFEAGASQRDLIVQSHGEIRWFPVSGSGDELLLLAIDRVARSQRQSVVVVDKHEYDSDQANDLENECLIDEPLELALTEWR